MSHRRESNSPSARGAGAAQPTLELVPARSDAGRRGLTIDVDDRTGVLEQRVIDAMDDVSSRIQALEAVRRISSDVPENAVDAVLCDWLATHRTTLKRLARAFIAIEAGVYGRCDICGRAIEIAALIDEPTTVRCAHCSSPDAGTSRP